MRVVHNKKSKKKSNLSYGLNFVVLDNFDNTYSGFCEEMPEVFVGANTPERCVENCVMLAKKRLVFMLIHGLQPVFSENKYPSGLESQVILNLYKVIDIDKKDLRESLEVDTVAISNDCKVKIK